MGKSELLAPVVKWAGGKRQLIPEIIKWIPPLDTISTYYEPFVGGGAVLFRLKPKRAVINDINGELINLYKVIRDDVEALIEDLKKHKNEKEYFYAIRELDRNPDIYNSLSLVEKASRTLYLNKTCFNGLYRVNSAGHFNVPFGRYKNPNIVNADTLRAVSRYFNKADVRILRGDFEDCVKWARERAFVYFDPPYHPVSDTSNFTSYSEDGFGEEEQRRLKELCDRLNAKGIKFLLSNSSTDFIRKLYDGYKIETVPAKRAINSDANGRGPINEVLIRNY